VEIYVGKRNRFGVNIGYGGKKDGLFYWRKYIVRIMNGRMIGVNRDERGNDE
jgi:glycine cleavage system pyridoxal-binding protein P